MRTHFFRTGYLYDFESVELVLIKLHYSTSVVYARLVPWPEDFFQVYIRDSLITVVNEMSVLVPIHKVDVIVMAVTVDRILVEVLAIRVGDFVLGDDFARDHAPSRQ